MSDESIQSLQSLGFTELEAAIYAFLLQEPGATGYRIAHAVGKPTANTYKAISTLEAKGALLVDEGNNRLCRAVPPDELLNQMEANFRHRRQRASEALARLGGNWEDTRVYQLGSWEQVMERARQMLRTCRKVVLLSVFPEPLEAIRTEVEQAVDRGVAVLLKVYSPVDVPGAQVVLSTEAESVRELWPGQELSLVIDAEEYLNALLQWDSQGVVQAVWSRSLFLAFNHYNGLYCEWMLTTLVSKIQANRSPKDIQADLSPDPILASLNWSHHPGRTPGYRRLVQQSGRSQKAKEQQPE